MKPKTPGSAEKDRSVLAKVPKLGASLTSFVRRPERAQSPIAEVPMSSPPPPKSAAREKTSWVDLTSSRWRLCRSPSGIRRWRVLGHLLVRRKG